jgi:hypothetical protein
MLKAKQMILSVWAFKHSRLHAAAEKDKIHVQCQITLIMKNSPDTCRRTEKDEKEKPLLIMHWRHRSDTAGRRTENRKGNRLQCNMALSNASPETVKRWRRRIRNLGSHAPWITVNPEWLKTHSGTQGNPVMSQITKKLRRPPAGL